MATYDELFQAGQDQALQNKVTVAATIAADTILQGNDTTNPPWDQTAPQPANRRIWAKQTFEDPTGTGRSFMPALIAANSTATLAQITGASDINIQNAVNAAVDIFADGN
jgi:hypothetical protein